MEKQDSLITIYHRNQFYREQHDSLAIIVCLLVLLFITLVGFNFYQQVTYPKPKYFPTTADGRSIPLIPLNNPLYDNDFVLKWAMDAILNIYSFDFMTYRSSLQNAKQYFTFKGYADFLIALKQSNNLIAVRERKQIVSAEIISPGKITFSGQKTANAPYSWDMEIPLAITYQSSAVQSLTNPIIVQKGIVYLTVERGSTLNTYNGLAIAQQIFRVE